MEEQIGLNKLNVGEYAVVRELCCASSIRRRLCDIGLVPNTPVCCIGRSPFGDPAAYEIRGSVLAIRDTDARGILVERVSMIGEADDDGTA